MAVGMAMREATATQLGYESVEALGEALEEQEPGGHWPSRRA